MNGDTIDVDLAYGSTGMSVRLPAAATTVITPRPREAAPDPLAVAPSRHRQPGRRTAVARPRTSRSARGDLRLRRDEAAAAAGDAASAHGGPRRRHPAGGRRRADRDRDPSGLDDRRAPRDARGGRARRVAGRRSRRARPDEPGRPRHGRRRAGPPRARVGRGGPADHDRLRGATLLRRVQRRAQDGRAGPGRARDHARAAQRPADRRPEGHLGRHRGEPGPRCRPGDHRGDARRLLGGRAPRRPAADHPRLRRRDAGDARGGLCRGEARGDAARPRAVRRRGHDQQRLPARPEPLPGGQGHVRGRRDREARRHDPLRGGMP